MPRAKKDEATPITRKKATKSVPPLPAEAMPNADPATSYDLAEQIRERAYQLYEQRSGHNGEGSAEEDWYRAEQEILEKYAKKLA